MRPTASLLLVTLAVFFAAGCTAPATRGTRPTEANPLEFLKKGLTGDEVKAVWGNPEEIRPLAEDTENAKVWVYRRNLRTTQRPVAATLQEVPFFDPISGEYRPFKEPYFNEQTSTIVQTVELVMVDDRLAGWHRSLSEQRTFR